MIRKEVLWFHEERKLTAGLAWTLFPTSESKKKEELEYAESSEVVKDVFEVTFPDRNEVCGMLIMKTEEYYDDKNELCDTIM